MPEPLAVAHDADRRDQLVAFAAQGEKLDACCCKIAGLSNHTPSADQHLIGADHQTAGMAAGDMQALRLGEGGRAFRGGSTLGAEGGLDLVLVDRRRRGGEGDAGIAQQRPPRRARGGKDERWGASVSSPCRRASSLRIAAAVSSIERRETSITGQWF